MLGRNHPTDLGDHAIMSRCGGSETIKGMCLEKKQVWSFEV